MPTLFQKGKEVMKMPTGCLQGDQGKPEQRYAGTMWPLVKKDIKEALQKTKG